MRFIKEYPKALSKELCQKIIAKFEEAPGLQRVGEVYNGGKVELSDFKVSTDMYIDNIPHWREIKVEIDKALEKCFIDYSKGIRIDPTPSLQTPYQIQRYEKGKGKFKEHIDNSGFGQAQYRYVAVIIYLNDVEKGGETTFNKQHFYIKPEEGKIALFPPYYTHPHIGEVPHSGPKYIITSFYTHPPIMTYEMVT